MKVAAIQHDIVWEDPRATRARVAPLIAEAAAGGRAARSCSPRCSRPASRCSPSASPRTRAGRASSSWSNRPRAHDVLAWSRSIAQRGADGRATGNNARARRARTARSHRYAKIHPFSYAGEHEHYAAGDRFLTVDVDGVRVHALRLLRPALRRRVLGARGRHRLLRRRRPTGPQPRREHWRALLRARAIENQAYVIGVNRVGAVQGPGRTSAVRRCIDPTGRGAFEGRAARERSLAGDGRYGLVMQTGRRSRSSATGRGS